jgi:hypothetical protein
MNELEWRARYEERINSEEWISLKRRLIRLRGQTCERCGHVAPLDLHHRTYERLGEEADDDLQLVCRSCHLFADAEREAEGHERSMRALDQSRFDRGLNTYATKKYGEDWEYTQDPCEVEEEFADWLERRA